MSMFKHVITYGKDGRPSDAATADAAELWEHRDGERECLIEVTADEWGRTWKFTGGAWHDDASRALRDAIWYTPWSAFTSIMSGRQG